MINPTRRKWKERIKMWNLIILLTCSELKVMHLAFKKQLKKKKKTNDMAKDNEKTTHLTWWIGPLKIPWTQNKSSTSQHRSYPCPWQWRKIVKNTLVHQQEKLNKKFNSKSLSVIFNSVCALRVWCVCVCVCVCFRKSSINNYN